MIAREMKELAMNVTECTDKEFAKVIDRIRYKAKVGNYECEYFLRTTNPAVIAALTERLEQQGFVVNYNEDTHGDCLSSLEISWY